MTDQEQKHAEHIGTGLDRITATMDQPQTIRCQDCGRIVPYLHATTQYIDGLCTTRCFSCGDVAAQKALRSTTKENHR